MPHVPSTRPRRPLIVRLCNMVGDVVLGVPALKLLEAQGYDLRLYGKAWAPKLLEAHGWPCVVRAGKLRARVAQLRELKQQCLAQDAGFAKRVNTLVMPNSFSSAFEVWCAGLNVSGYSRDGRGLLFSRKERPTSKQHSLDGFWQLACSFLDIELPPPDSIGLRVTDAALDQADALLAQAGVAPGFICIVPYAAGVVDKQEKKWPAFAACANRLPELGRAVVTCPGPGEEGIAQAGYGNSVILPGLDLPTYGALLQRAALVISNDTGPAHMAAALGGYVFSVLGPTKAEQWAPWGSHVRVVQRPGRQWPDVQEVLAAAQAMLAERE